MGYEKLSQLGPRLIGEKSSNLESEFKSIERLLPMTISYREALQAFGGAVVFESGAKFRSDEKSPLNDKDGYQTLEILYGLGDGKYSVRHKAAQYADELPASFVPIGETAAGNLICVASNGAVYLWDHESLRDGETWRIASSMDDFLGRLVPDESAICGTDGIVESESYLGF